MKHIFSKIEKSKNRKIEILKIEKISDFSKFSEKLFFSKNLFRSKKYFFENIFDENCSEHYFRQATLTHDASRAPRSDVAALRRKRNICLQKRKNEHSPKLFHTHFPIFPPETLLVT